MMLVYISHPVTHLSESDATTEIVAHHVHEDKHRIKTQRWQRRPIPFNTTLSLALFLEICEIAVTPSVHFWQNLPMQFYIDALVFKLKRFRLMIIIMHILWFQMSQKVLTCFFIFTIYGKKNIDITRRSTKRILVALRYPLSF